MLSKEEVLKKCAEMERIIKANINLIPINNWHFDDEIMEQLREQKHKMVDSQLTEKQKQKLSKASKQRLAREIGADCRTITDVLNWMAKNQANTKPTKPNSVLKTVDAHKIAVKGIKSEYNKTGNSKVLDSKLANEQPLTEAGNGSPIKAEAAVDTNQNRKPKRKQRRENSSFDADNTSSSTATSAVAPADALEGRKLALKRLQEKLEQFKAKRRGKMTAHEYEEKRKLKRRMSKLKMKERRSAAKQQLKKSEIPLDGATPHKRPKFEADVKSVDVNVKKDEKLIFSKFDFIVRDDKKKQTKKDKRDRFAGKDYKRLLEKSERREERLEQIRAKNPEKAFKIEDDIQWKKALNRAEGQKVKDNPELLKKSLKKKEKLKEWRKKKWQKRVEHTEQMQARRQEKRLANIQARKEAVKKRKLKKARKKGRIL